MRLGTSAGTTAAVEESGWHHKSPTEATPLLQPTSVHSPETRQTPRQASNAPSKPHVTGGVEFFCSYIIDPIMGGIELISARNRSDSENNTYNSTNTRLKIKAFGQQYEKGRTSDDCDESLTQVGWFVQHI